MLTSKSYIYIAQRLSAEPMIYISPLQATCKLSYFLDSNNVLFSLIDFFVCLVCDGVEKPPQLFW